MKRMALLLAALFVLAAAILYLFGLNAVSILGVCLCFTAVGCVICNKKFNLGLKPAAVLLFGAVFCLYLNIYTFVKVERVEALAGSTHTVVGRVVEEPKYYDTYTRFEVETDGSNGFDKGLGGKVRLFVNVKSYLEASKATDGDILKLDLEFFTTDSVYKKYYKSENVYISTSCNSAEIIGHKESVYTKCIELRRGIRQAIDTYTEGDISAILQGILLGGTDKMSDELYEQFKACGVTHITAVSGMHISAFCTIFLSLLSLKLSRRKAAAITIIPLILSVMLAGLTPSAVRSGIMCGILLMSQVLLKRGDSLNSLGVSMVLMLAVNPYNVCNLGFQLSCSAAAGVILITPYGTRVAERAVAKVKWKATSQVLKNIVISFFQSIGAVVCTLPFQILEFGYVSIIAPIASLLICSASVYAMAACIVGTIVHCIPFFDYIAMMVFMVAKFLAEYIRAVVRLLSDLPFSYIAFGNNYAILWLGASLAVIALWIALGEKIKVRAVALMITLMLIVSLWAEQFISYNMGTVTVLDVGNGLCVVVTFDEDCAIIGCGDDYSDSFVVSKYLRKNSITKIDMLLIPSDSETCFGGFKGFISNFKPERIAVPANFGDKITYSGQTEWIADNGEVCSGNSFLNFKTHFVNNGCVYELVFCEKNIIIGCGKFDGKEIGVQSTDILISGRVAPIDIFSAVTVASAESEEYLELYPLSDRKIATAGRSISFKLKEGKAISVYAG